MNTVCIINPVSTEFNRGSFCYLPYLLYGSIQVTGSFRVMCFEEDFSIAEIDHLPVADIYYVALWSHTQIEACLVLKRFLDKPVLFFGYYPLIKSLGLPEYKVTEKEILEGMYYYPEFYQDFRFLLLSDCDMHLQKYKGTVYPLFTSYGCPMGCCFCPSTVNCDKKRLQLLEQETKDVLTNCFKRGVTNIHFTDEDLFLDIDHAYVVLSTMKELGNMQSIALGSVKSVNRFINKYGIELLEDSGLKLIEIGFETADNSLSLEMGKTGISDCIQLNEKLKGTSVKIFWLTLTFFPGETLHTLNQTGRFLKEYGFKREELYGRIQTNGTEGGLGQFFQIYPGTIAAKFMCNGLVLTPRPMRLLPSFIPESFLNCFVSPKRYTTSKDMVWFDMYKIPSKIVNDILLTKGMTVREHVLSYNSYMEKMNVATCIAICARLEII